MCFLDPSSYKEFHKAIKTAESIQYELRGIFSLIENDILDNSIFLDFSYLFI